MTALEGETSPPVRATFDDIDAASRAVRKLLEKSVPADSIRVLLLDARGDLLRALPVEDEAGALRGALIGAAVGTAIGVLVVVVAAALALRGGTASSLFSFGGAFAAIAGTAAACVPLGALWGMGSWRGRTKLSGRDADADRVAVVVETTELAALARMVLSEAPGRLSER